MKKYFRSQDITNSGRTVYGYCIVFDTESVDLGGFQEIIRKSAVSEDLIEKSDIFLNWNHNQDYVLARSKKGKGNLELRIDNHGLFFQADLPDTAKGNEVLSYIQRGELDECSFCFSLDYNDKSSERWTYRNDNTQLREILKINELYDVALCFKGAYSDTECSLRDLEHCKNEINKLNEQRDMSPEEKQEEQNNLKEIDTLKEEIKELKEEQLEKDLEQLDEKLAEIEQKSEEKEDNSEKNIEKQDESELQETAKEEQETAKEDSEEDEKQDNEEDEEEKKEKKSSNKQINIKNNINHRTMKQENFLLKEIRNALKDGKKSILVPACTETRTVTVTDQGESPNVVPGVHDSIIDTEIQGILEPLYSDSILFNLGCRTYSGVPYGDIQIPLMSKTSVGWAGEISAATATGVTFDTVLLSPKRLTAYIDISKMLLKQDTHQAEAAIRRDIVNALNDKLQETFFSDEAGTEVKPAGIFYNQELTEIEGFADIADLEATIDDNNISGNRKYVVSNKAKAALRVMPKSSLTNQLMLESGEIDGTPVVATSAIEDKNMVYGDFSNIVICSWDNIELVLDEYTAAINGCIRLIINAYFDFKIVRPEGLAFAKIKE